MALGAFGVFLPAAGSLFGGEKRLFPDEGVGCADLSLGCQLVPHSVRRARMDAACCGMRISFLETVLSREAYS